MIKSTTITFGRLKFNGKDCQDPLVTLVGATNVAIKCVDENNNSYTVQSLDGNDLPKCLTFIVSCGECSECENKVIERCLCSGPNDCGPCQDCVDGACIDRCKPGQDCVNGRCVDCKSDGDCPCNQKCLPNGCACPTGTTLNPINKCCDQCATDGDCGPCFECVEINGAKTCVKRPCADGVCDPETGGCVECLTSGDCANKSCKHCDPVLKQCIAIPGVQLQVTKGQCIDSPECLSDADCGNCEMCMKNGKCGPIITCGPDQILDKRSCKCVDRCDCNNPACPEGYYCASVDNHNNCGCFKCEGDCTNGCVSPCYCDKTINKCVSSPCSNKPCNEGVDCGPGCGCKNGKCVPCQSQDCDSLNPSCLTVKGCTCSGNQCTGDDCGRAPCENINDCGPGCTCYQGECTGCSNFSCDGLNSCAQQVGCKCVSGNCVNDPDDRACKDTIIMEATDQGCNLIGMLTKDTPCYCTHLVVNAAGKIIGTSADAVELEMIVQLRKNTIGPDFDISNLPLLSDSDNPDIAENETPVQGMFELKITSFEQYLNQGQLVNPERQIVKSSASLPTLKGEPTVAVFSKVNVPKIGTTYTDAQGFERTINSVVIEVYRKSTIKVTNNNCEYRNTDGQSPFAIYRVMSNNDFNFSEVSHNNLKGKQITSSSSRYPMFKWYRGNTVLRKEYIAPDQGSNNKYVDILNQDEYDLKSCEQYTLEIDCTCEAPAQETFIWKKGQLEIDVLDCGTAFEIKNFDTCAANKDNTFYIKWGSQEKTWVPGEAMSFPQDRFTNNDGCIGDVDWGIKCGGQYHSFEETIKVPCTEFDPPVVLKRCTNDGKLELTFPTELISKSGNVVKIIRVLLSPIGVNAYQVIDNAFVNRGTQVIKVDPGTYNYTLELDSGCEYEGDGVIGDNCCSHKDTLPDYWSRFYRDASDNNQISGNVKNNEFTIGSDPTKYNRNNVIDRLRDIDGYNQSISIVETDSERCTKTHLIEAGCATWNNVSFIAEPGASNNTARIAPNPTQSVANMVLLTSDPNVQITKRTNDWAISNLTPGTSYSFTVEHDSCTGTKSVSYTQAGCGHTVQLSVNQPNCNSLTSAWTNASGCQCPNYQPSIKVDVIDLRANDMDLRISSLVNLFDSSLRVTSRELKYNTGSGSLNVPNSNCNNDKANCSGTITVPRPVAKQCIGTIDMIAQFSSGSQPNWVTVRLSLFDNGTPYDEFARVYVNNNLLNKNNLRFEAERGDSVSIKVEVIQNGVSHTQTIDLDINGTQGSVKIPFSQICSTATTTAGEDIIIGVYGFGLNDNCMYNDFEVSVNTLDLVQAANGITKSGVFNPLQANVRHKKVTYYERTDGVNWNEILVEWVGGSSSILRDQYTNQGADYRADVFCNCLKQSPVVPLCCMPQLTFTANNCVESVEIELTGIPGVYDVVAGYQNDYQNDPDTVSHQMTIPAGGGTTGNVSQLFTFPSPLAYNRKYYARVVSVSDSCVEEESWTTPSDIMVAGVQVCNNAGTTPLYDLEIHVTIDGVALNSGDYAGVLLNPPAGVTWDQGNQTIRNLNNTGNMLGTQVNLQITPNTGTHNGCVKVYTHAVDEVCAQPQTLACPTCNNLPQGNVGVPVDDPLAVEVSWTSVTGATGYGIEIFENNISNKVLDVKRDATPAFRSFNMIEGTGNGDGLGNLKPNTTYLIRVTSYEDTDPSMTPDCTGSMLTVTTAAVAGCDQANVDVIATLTETEYDFYVSTADQGATNQDILVPTPSSGFIWDLPYRCNKERVNPNALVESNVNTIQISEIVFDTTRDVLPGWFPENIRVKVAPDNEVAPGFNSFVNSANNMTVDLDMTDTTVVPNMPCTGCAWYDATKLVVPAGGITQSWMNNFRQAIINKIAWMEREDIDGAGSTSTTWRQMYVHGQQYKIYMSYFTDQNQFAIGFVNKLYSQASGGTRLLLNRSSTILWGGTTSSGGFMRGEVMGVSTPEIYHGTGQQYFTDYSLRGGGVRATCNWNNQCDGNPVAISKGFNISGGIIPVYGDPFVTHTIELSSMYGPTITCNVATFSAVVSGCDPNLGTPTITWTDNSTGQVIGTGSNIAYDVVNVNAQYSVAVANCCSSIIDIPGIIPTSNNPA